MASVFDLFDLPRVDHSGETKEELPVPPWAKFANLNHLAVNHASGATFSRAEAAALLEKQHQSAFLRNDENTCDPASSCAKCDFKVELNLPRHFAGLVCDARRPAGATYSRSEAAALFVAYNRLNQVRPLEPRVFLARAAPFF
jgi:hypothetical protein